jgi:hypothetical protein
MRSTAPGQKSSALLLFDSEVLRVPISLIKDDPKQSVAILKMASGGKVFLRPSYGQSGLPHVVASEGSMRIRFSKAGQTSEVYRKIQKLRKWPSAVDVCRWKETAGVWTKRTGVTLRLPSRPFPDFLGAAYWPSPLDATFTTSATVNGTAATVTVDTGSVTAHGTVEFSTTPAATDGQRVCVRWTPLFLCYVVDAPGLAISQDNANTEQRDIVLEDAVGA